MIYNVVFLSSLFVLKRELGQKQKPWKVCKRMIIPEKGSIGKMSWF